MSGFVSVPPEHVHINCKPRSANCRRPISTYNRQGVAKEGINKSEHAVIYSGRSAPEMDRTERPRRGEQGVLAQPIRVDPDDASERLDSWSRLDFGKVYNIEHKVKVRSFGMVNAASRPALQTQFRMVWEQRQAGPGSQVQLQTPQGVQIETVESSEAAQSADMVCAYNTLLANGWTTERIRRCLNVGFQLPTAGQTTNPDDEGSSSDDGTVELPDVLLPASNSASLR